MTSIPATSPMGSDLFDVAVCTVANLHAAPARDAVTAHWMYLHLADEKARDLDTPQNEHTRAPRARG
jgi:hypothetical protein